MNYKKTEKNLRRIPLSSPENTIKEDKQNNISNFLKSGSNKFRKFWNDPKNIERRKTIGLNIKDKSNQVKDLWNDPKNKELRKVIGQKAISVVEDDIIKSGLGAEMLGVISPKLGKAAHIAGEKYYEKKNKQNIKNEALGKIPEQTPEYSNKISLSIPEKTPEYSKEFISEIDEKKILDDLINDKLVTPDKPAIKVCKWQYGGYNDDDLIERTLETISESMYDNEYLENNYQQNILNTDYVNDINNVHDYDINNVHDDYDVYDDDYDDYDNYDIYDDVDYDVSDDDLIEKTSETITEKIYYDEENMLKTDIGELY